MNEMVLNQVLVSFGDAAITRRIIADVQSDGSCWCGGNGVAGSYCDAHQCVKLGHHRLMLSTVWQPFYG